MTVLSSTMSLRDYGLEGIRKMQAEGESPLPKGTLVKNTATPAMRAEHAAQLRASEQLVAVSNVAIARAQTQSSDAKAPPIKVENVGVSFPNVESLSKESAAAVLKNLQYMQDHKQLDGREITALKGDAKATNIEMYKDWLQMKIGVDAYA